jgi:hypothetical protein
MPFDISTQPFTPMNHPNAKKPTPTELENLIYEVAFNRALIQALLQVLDKTQPDLVREIEQLLHSSPQRVYSLVSEFVEEPSPYYEPLLNARKENADAEKAAQALKDLLKPPPDKP